MVDKAVGVFSLIVGLAALSVVLSRKSQTAAVLKALLGGFRDNVKTAISPIV